MKKSQLRALLVGTVILAIACFFYFDLGQFLSFEYLNSQQAQFQAFKEKHFLLAVGGYFLIYVLVTSLSLPGAAIMTLAGGAMFGVVMGTIVVSFASTIGATLAFLAARFVLRDSIQQKFGDKLRAINRGIEKEGAFYLFTLRLVPAFPFFVINLVMGLTPIKTIQFFLVSQVGMLPGTIVYVNAGTQLSKISSLKEILSLELALSFAALGLFPLFAKKLIEFIKKKRAHHA